MPYAGIFEKMPFKPYAYLEYPKALTLKDGSVVIVGDAKEEIKMITEVVPKQDFEALETEKLDMEERLNALTQELDKAKAELASRQTATVSEKFKTPPPVLDPKKIVTGP